jgi:CHAT domain-containing protein
MEISDAVYLAREPERAITLVDVWEKKEASEARLLAQAPPPRVLHLATHGFYHAPTKPLHRPLVLAGVALAGANAALQDGRRDGILYAIEEDLNLEGTELVVLSACETAQGQIEYGEGVSGLVRASRTAGARNVLVTFKPVSDQGASAFMRRFYHYWLAQQGRSDPAAALRAAQLEAIGAATQRRRGPDLGTVRANRRVRDNASFESDLTVVRVHIDVRYGCHLLTGTALPAC